MSEDSLAVQSGGQEENETDDLMSQLLKAAKAAEAGSSSSSASPGTYLPIFVTFCTYRLFNKNV